MDPVHYSKTGDPLSTGFPLSFTDALFPYPLRMHEHQRENRAVAAAQSRSAGHRGGHGVQRPTLTCPSVEFIVKIRKISGVVPDESLFKYDL